MASFNVRILKNQREREKVEETERKEEVGRDRMSEGEMEKKR